MHQLVHLFNDVQNKGVTANYSTKPGENMHAVLHYAYDRSSKKRGTVDAEVLHKSHVLAAYDLVAAEIKAMEALSTTQEEPEDGSEDVYHVKLASRKRLLTLALLEEQNRGDKAFVRLGTRVRACIARLDPSFKFSVDSPVKLYECHTLMVQYESMVDWCLHRDRLRCNPLFYGKERRDCVLVHANPGVSPARLLALMDCFESGDDARHLPLAIVLYFDPVLGPIGEVERAMGFRRFRLRRHDQAEVISVRSIIRGALMVPTLSSTQQFDYLANDLVDEDMYLRFYSYSKQKLF
ncbi:hypothetical protein FRC08_012697 [Ceratobasidium sp. 394]|nr:hypothetical protein FRC08_012697 [Ceratobasidium sp. 394]